MLLNRTTTAVVTSTEAPLFVITGPNAGGLTIFLENLDTTNYVAYRVQTAESNLALAFTDLPSDSVLHGVAGNFATAGILTPSSSSLTSNQVMISIRTSSSYLRLLVSSSGGAQLNYGITTLTPSTSSNFTNGVL